MTLQENMHLAWQERAETVAAELRAYQAAPALVRPEFALNRVTDLRRCMAEMQRWS